METIEMYCVKCKKKVQVDEYRRATTKNGRPMLKGVCPGCGTKVTKFVKADKEG